MNEQTSADKKKHRLNQFLLSFLDFRGMSVAKPNELYREQYSVSMTSMHFNENMSSNKIVIIDFEMTCQFVQFKYAFRFASFGILWMGKRTETHTHAHCDSDSSITKFAFANHCIHTLTHAHKTADFVSSQNDNWCVYNFPFSSFIDCQICVDDTIDVFNLLLATLDHSYIKLNYVPFSGIINNTLEIAYTRVYASQ